MARKSESGGLDDIGDRLSLEFNTDDVDDF
jgi:hypothetical protein